MISKSIVNKVSSKLNLPPSIIEETYKAYWLFIKHTLESLPLKEDLTEEDFSLIRTSINIPSLGKFNCTYDRYCRIKDRYKKNTEGNEEANQDKTNV